MPALSPTMEKGTLASWDKKEGDEVKAGDVLAQVETDKATVSFDSTEDGFIAKILLAAGSSDVAVGTPVAIFVDEADKVAAFKDYVHGGAAAPAAPAATAPAPAAAAAAAAAPASAVASGPSCSNRGVLGLPGDDDVSPAAASSGARVFATPAARAAAAARGIDVSQVTGTGPNHRVVKADILEFTPVKAAAAVATKAAAPVAAAPAAGRPAAPAPTAVPASAAGDYTDLPLSQMRKVIAQRLSHSKQTIPHYYVTVEVEMDAVLKLRGDLNKQLEAAVKNKEDAPKISVNDFVIKAVAHALRKVPAVNCSWQDTFVRSYNYADISVAVATDAGLITPIVTDADLKGLATISQDMKGLAKKARDGKLQPHEFQGGTFTVSNLGMFGVSHFSAIINPPQSGILAVGGTSTKVVPIPGAAADAAQQFKTVSVMSVTASFDHRVVDGATGAQWLAAFKGFLEKPATMLL